MQLLLLWLLTKTAMSLSALCLAEMHLPHCGQCTNSPTVAVVMMLLRMKGLMQCGKTRKRQRWRQQTGTEVEAHSWMVVEHGTSSCHWHYSLAVAPKCPWEAAAWLCWSVVEPQCWWAVAQLRGWEEGGQQGDGEGVQLRVWEEAQPCSLQ